MQKNRRRQISIRLLLIVTGVCAIVFAVGFLRPEPTVRVEIQADGALLIEGKEVPRGKKLVEIVDHHRRQRERWFVKPKVELAAESTVLFSDMEGALRDCASTGIEQISICLVRGIDTRD